MTFYKYVRSAARRFAIIRGWRIWWVGALACAFGLASISACTSCHTTSFGRLKRDLPELEKKVPAKRRHIVTALTPLVPRAQALKEIRTSEDLPLEASSTGRALERVLTDRTVDSVQVVSIQLDQLGRVSRSTSTLGDPETLLQMKIAKESLGKAKDGMRTWWGLLAGGSRANGDALFVWRGDRASGVIRTDQEWFTVRPLGNGLHALTTTLPAFADRDSNDVGDADLQSAGTVPSLMDCSPASEKTSLDVLVYATSKALVQSGQVGHDDMAARVELAALLMNISLERSAINGKINVVGEIKELSVENESLYEPVLKRLIAGTDEFTGVHSERKARQADVVVLVVHNDNPRECGRAAAIPASAAAAFAVVNQQCLTDKFSFAHEIAHLAGAHHEPRRESLGPPSPPFAQGFFSKVSKEDCRKGFATVMAHRDNCLPCIRIPNFSNPDEPYCDVPTGTLDHNNNACVLRNMLPHMSKFGDSLAAPAAAQVYINADAPVAPPRPKQFNDTDPEEGSQDAKPTTPKVYVVQHGDNLSVLAARFYGRQIWQRIYRANRRTVHDPDLIFPGQILFIP